MRSRMRTLVGLGTLVGCLGVCLPAGAQDQPQIYKKEHPLVSSLKDVILHGASLFNDKGDHAGCYRVYQGALLAIRPYLNDKPDLLKFVNEKLRSAESLPTYVDRAFALRKVLDSVRDAYRTAPPPNLPPPNVGPGSGKQPAETIDAPKKLDNPPDGKKDENKKVPTNYQSRRHEAAGPGITAISDRVGWHKLEMCVS